MKRLFTYLVVLLLPVMHVVAVGNVLYVSTDGTGDGSSWANASSLTAAADAARAMEVKPEIWVKKGTYVFTDSINFDYLLIYGGFNGDETALNERNWATNVTIFDGNNVHSLLRNSIGTGRAGGNATSILSILDGVIVQNGLSPSANNGGAMIINNGAIVRNCIFRNNATQNTKHGAAIHCNNGTNLVIENCLFTNNTSVGNGGAIQIGGGTTITVRSCTFANNSAVKGGAFCAALDASSNMNLYNSVAYNNLHGTDYQSYSGNGGVNKGGTIISKNSAVEGTSTKFTNGDDVNHIVLSRTVVPGFVSPATIIGKGANETEITEINNASYRLLKTSPCVDKGLNSEATVENIPYDLDHTTRIFADYVDMGAYECVYEPNAISSPSDANFKANTVNNELRVSGALKGEKLQLFDMQGKLLETVVITEDNEIAKFRLLNRGVYLVAAHNKLIKVNY